MIAGFFLDLLNRVLANFICIGVCVVAFVIIRNIGRRKK